MFSITSILSTIKYSLIVAAVLTLGVFTFKYISLNKQLAQANLNIEIIQRNYASAKVANLENEKTIKPIEANNRAFQAQLAEWHIKESEIVGAEKDKINKVRSLANENPEFNKLYNTSLCDDVFGVCWPE